jgi:hypothetical protein
MFRLLYRVIIRRTAPILAADLQSSINLVSHKEHYRVLIKFNYKQYTQLILVLYSGFIIFKQLLFTDS